ncbi:MAG: amidohydrolase family protein [Bacteroidia bacterium]|nr:amidohydrolase family protein [Bacteroidia bacterium]
MHTTIVRNGTYYDGTGAPGRIADVLIQNQRVQGVFDKAPEIEGAREIDASGKWVTPGFLDIHTHYDAEIEVMPGLEESIRHGTTTVVMGNCSISAALGKDEDIVDLFCRVENIPAQVLTEWIKDKISWNNLAEYYEHLESLPMGPNVSSFIGHSNIRIAAMGLERSFKQPKANKTELKAMQNILAEAMDAGYLGMSIDMLPFHRWAGIFTPEYKGASVPSQQAAVGEYKKLANVLRKYNRVLQATPNALDKMSGIHLLSMSSGIFRKPLKTTVVAAMDLKSDENIYKLVLALSSLGKKFLNADMRFQALSMPFLNYGEGPITPLFEEFPSMVHVLGSTREERHEAFGDPKFRSWFTEDWNHKTTSVFPRLLKEMTVTGAPDNQLVGHTFQDLADKKGVDGLEYLMDLIREYDTDLKWKCIAANHREEQRIQLLANDHTIPGFNDSGAHNVNMAFHDGALQTLRQAQNHPDQLPIEKAIYRLTSLPAEWLGLDAGSIKPGDRADLVVLDPKKLSTNLHDEPIEDYHPSLKGACRFVKRSDGVINHVFINGKEAFSETDGFAADLGQNAFGRLLRSQHN